QLVIGTRIIYMGRESNRLEDVENGTVESWLRGAFQLRFAEPSRSRRCSFNEQVHCRERLSRPGPEAIEGELRRLSGLRFHMHEVVILFGSLALPILIQRIAVGDRCASCREGSDLVPRLRRRVPDTSRRPLG